MIEAIEAVRDVSLDEPRGSCPVILDFSERSCTTALWAKSMGMGRELRFVIRLEDEAYDFLYQLV